jgi:CheY-like chemotaxis protein
MDIQVPVLDGLTATKLIGADERFRLRRGEGDGQDSS